MNIGDHIRNTRKRKNMTLQQMADILGCSQQNISQYESGKRTPKLGTLRKMADALNVTVNDLMEGSLDESPVYRALKNNDMLDGNLAQGYLNAKLAEEFRLRPIDIELLKIFKTLNETGQAAAIERIEELAEIPRYARNEAMKER